MRLPIQNQKMTREQVGASINIEYFPEFIVEKNWHHGIHYDWAKYFGYSDGFPIYGGIRYKVDNIEQTAHVVFLNDGHQLPIILPLDATPMNYGVYPEEKG